MSHLTDEQLSGFMDDALDASARATCETHLASCEPCRERLAEWSALERELAPALTHDPGEEYFASFSERDDGGEIIGRQLVGYTSVDVPAGRTARTPTPPGHRPGSRRAPRCCVAAGRGVDNA